MGVNSVQVALNATTATPIVVQGAGNPGDGTFRNVTGAMGDELPLLITNTSATIVVYLGGYGVTSATGTPLQPNAALPMSFLGTDATDLFAIAASATPTVSVFAGRQ